MALLPQADQLNNRKQLAAKDIKIKNDIKSNIGEKKYLSKERKPIQVNPPTLEMIRNIAYAKDMKMYEVVQTAMEAYLNTLSKDERKLYDRRPTKYS